MRAGRPGLLPGFGGRGCSRLSAEHGFCRADREYRPFSAARSLPAHACHALGRFRIGNLDHKSSRLRDLNVLDSSKDSIEGFTEMLASEHQIGDDDAEGPRCSRHVANGLRGVESFAPDDLRAIQPGGYRAQRISWLGAHLECLWARVSRYWMECSPGRTDTAGCSPRRHGALLCSISNLRQISDDPERSGRATRCGRRRTRRCGPAGDILR